MAEILSLNDAYSTTRRVTKTLPEFDGILLYPENVKQGGLRTKGLFKRSEADRPLITVVTVVYNGAEFLEETIKSVINQTYDNVEYVVVDGGSTDGTLDILKRYEHCIDYWISERDKGIYDAMNKSLHLYTGTSINFLNAADVFYNENVLSVVSERFKDDAVNIVYGGAEICHGVQRTLLMPKKFTMINLLIWGTRVVCHQAIFVKRNSAPMYPTDLRLKGELEWYFRILKDSATFSIIEAPVVRYQLGGVGDINYVLNTKEAIRVAFRCKGVLGFVSLPVLFYKYLKKAF